MRTLFDKMKKKKTSVDKTKPPLTEEEYDRLKEIEFYKLFPNSLYKSTLHNTHKKTQREIRNENIT